MSSTPKRIAVIGAGAAGLSAAFDLLKQGHTVTVFEASDKPGGLAAGFKQPTWNWTVEKFYHHWFASDADMLALARNNITDRGLDDRVWTLHGDVARIPLPDNSTNLAVSRGSVFFWDKPALAFAEIHRVLAPGGRAVIGGGFGSAELKEQISRTMEARDKEPGQWRAKLKRNLSTETGQTYESALREAGVTDFGIELSEETGFWITIGK